jgi:hypothetical protein
MIFKINRPIITSLSISYIATWKHFMLSLWMDIKDIIFRLLHISNLPSLVVLTPPHSPCTPFVNCVHFFANYVNSSINYDNTSTDCINFLLIMSTNLSITRICLRIGRILLLIQLILIIYLLISFYYLAFGLLFS